jgi:hypothetical protein
MEKPKVAEKVEAPRCAIEGASARVAGRSVKESFDVGVVGFAGFA